MVRDPVVQPCVDMMTRADLPVPHDTVDELLLLPHDILVIILEQLPFDAVLTSRAACVRLQDSVACITRAVVHREEQLYVPLLQLLGNSLLCLELEGVSPDWLPRLGCCMGVLPRLQRLFIRRAGQLPREQIANATTVAVSGALQAGACRGLHHLNIDERFPEENVMRISCALQPDAGLLFAASHGYETVLSEMLRRGASPEATLEDGASPLLVACYHGGKPVTKLLEMGANVRALRRDGVSALIMASNRGHVKTVEELVRANADVNHTMPDGTSALHTATYKSHQNVVTVLLGAHANVTARCHDGVTPLLMAAKSGKDEIVGMLLHARAGVDATLRDGGTPLLAAAYKGHPRCIEQLIAAGASVNACRPDGLTPLCQASKAGHARCVELLLEARADVEAAGAVYGTTSLLMASKGGHKHIVELLLRYGADTEVAGRAYGTTSLVAAATHGHVDVVRLLLDGRADPHKQLNTGKTALDTALESREQRDRDLGGSPLDGELSAPRVSHGFEFDRVIRILREAMGQDQKANEML